MRTIKNRIFSQRRGQIGKGGDIFLATLLLVGFILFIMVFYKPAGIEDAEKQKEADAYIVKGGLLNYFLRSPLSSFDPSGLTPAERDARNYALSIIDDPVVADLFILGNIKASLGKPIREEKLNAAYKSLINNIFSQDENLKRERFIFFSSFQRFREDLSYFGEGQEFGGLPDKCEGMGSFVRRFPNAYSDIVDDSGVGFFYCTDKK